MSRTRIVKGNITKITGGNYKVCSIQEAFPFEITQLLGGKSRPRIFQNKKSSTDHVKLFLFFLIVFFI